MSGNKKQTKTEDWEKRYPIAELIKMHGICSKLNLKEAHYC
jgi:hypothetical protein